MAKRTVSIELLEEGDERYLVSHYSTGEVVRKSIVPKKATRKPRLKKQKIKPRDHTRKKRF